jgi:signal transduction histidine kinase/CheY-like chemotaxis protein/HPt (histidine-containing phosphotransfer) domain-containing protein
MRARRWSRWLGTGPSPWWLAIGIGGVLLAIGLVGWHLADRTIARFGEVHRTNLAGASALARIQAALWELRSDVLPLRGLDGPERRRLVEAQERAYARIDQAIRAYASQPLGLEERAALAAWQDAYARYVRERPRWLELLAAGRTTEAAGWQAERVTPRAMAALRSLETLIGVQADAAHRRHADVARAAQVSVAVLIGTRLLAAFGAAGLVVALVRLRARERQLVVLRRAAEEATVAKSQFLAAMSHEIRTPLNGVIGMTDLLLDTPLTTDQRQLAETVRGSGRVLLSVINDVLDFSRIEAGRIELEPGPVTIREAVGETLKTVAALAHDKRLDLGYDVAPAVPDVLELDAGRVAQVLLNLVGNAIKFTPAGEVTVHVDVEADAPAAVTLHLVVRDTGIGITPEQQTRIFEPFTQADTSTSRRFGGSGLGLAISHRLVALMGGRLWVESEAGRGSAFHFTVPGRRPSEPGPPPRRLPTDGLHGLPVLLADDRAVNRQFLGGLLRAWGMAVTVVEDGAAAIAAFTRARAAGAPFRIALLDGQMPGRDGLAVAARMREAAPADDLALLLLVSGTNPAVREAGRTLGVARFLLTPLTPSELLDAILLALGQPGGPAPGGEKPAAEPTARPLRVLVAEDNAVNQILVTRLLGQLGHSVLVVGNGREALEAVQQQAFDAVLMDVQMPEIDGFSATAAIREREARTPGSRRLPILGLTAHVMPGDRERCLAAGMEDYLTKPVRRAELAAALEQVAARRPAPARGDGGPGAAPPPAGTRAEPAPIDVAAALELVGGDRALLQEVLDMLAADWPARRATLREAYGQRDATALGRAAHALKGSCRAVAAGPAAALAERLETASRGAGLGGAGETLAALEVAVDRLVAFTRGGLGEAGPPRG